MLFQVSGMKQLDSKSKSVSFIIDCDDEQTVRSITSKYGVVILRLNVFDGDVKSQANIYGKISFDEKTYNIYGNFSKAREAYEFWAVFCGFNVVYINSLVTPLTDQQVELVIKKLQSEFQKDTVKKKADSQEADGKPVNEEALNKLKKTIDENIAEAESLMGKVNGYVSPVVLKKLKDIIDELKKYKMGKNMEKLGMLFETLLENMEQVEMLYIDALKSTEKQKISSQVLSDLEIVAEYDKYRKIKKLKSANIGTKDSQYYYYSIFGKFGFYLKVLIKEFLLKNQDLGTFSKGVYGGFEILCLFLIFNFVFYYVINLVIGNNKLGVFEMIWNVGLLGTFFYVFGAFKKDNFTVNFILILIVFALFFATRYFIIANFGF